MDTPRLEGLSFTLVDGDGSILDRYAAENEREPIPRPIRSALVLYFTTGNSLPLMAALQLGRG